LDRLRDFGHLSDQGIVDFLRTQIHLAPGVAVLGVSRADGRTYIYNASGTRIAGSAVGNPWAFTGQRYDAAVRLYHF
jgi:hypothetical protein